MKRISLVNTKQGSASVHRYSNGNTLPLMQVPFGMVSFCPQTDENLRWYYHPSHRSLMGIRIRCRLRRQMVGFSSRKRCDAAALHGFPLPAFTLRYGIDTDHARCCIALCF